MGKRIDGGETVAWVEIDGVVYAAEVRERGIDLVARRGAEFAERRGPGLRKTKALPPAEAA